MDEETRIHTNRFSLVSYVIGIRTRCMWENRGDGFPYPS